MTLYYNNQIDPIGVINSARELKLIPWHFVKIYYCEVKIADRKKMRGWIWKNLSGRFTIGTRYAAFEDPAEASMFALVKGQFESDF